MKNTKQSWIKFEGSDRLLHNKLSERSLNSIERLEVQVRDTDDSKQTYRLIFWDKEGENFIVLKNNAPLGWIKATLSVFEDDKKFVSYIQQSILETYNV